MTGSEHIEAELILLLKNIVASTSVEKHLDKILQDAYFAEAIKRHNTQLYLTLINQYQTHKAEDPSSNQTHP